MDKLEVTPAPKILVVVKAYNSSYPRVDDRFKNGVVTVNVFKTFLSESFNNTQRLEIILN